MATQTRPVMTGTRITEDDAKALKSISVATGKSVSEIIYDCVRARLDGMDHLEALRTELIDQVIAATEQSTVLMVEAVSAAVSSKSEESVRAALSDTSRSERDARAKLQLKVENLSNTVVAEIEKIDAKFKAINDTLVAIQKALAAKA
ncbi:hypothetical protein D769_20524 [Cupriavidus sp. HMR-1]|uniref:hypothetical protein n=1 Tax=Burkholderiaceae TaxID=119060 RepID=UPI0002A2D0BA|nr:MULTISPECIES: hypothetical protein [Burkholderiaceae]EKZ97386.1 hypothetical protein D769_20524 [Cupriavidus sp. HMR-1]